MPRSKKIDDKKKSPDKKVKPTQTKENKKSPDKKVKSPQTKENKKSRELPDKTKENKKSPDKKVKTPPVQTKENKKQPKVKNIEEENKKVKTPPVQTKENKKQPNVENIEEENRKTQNVGDKEKVSQRKRSNSLELFDKYAYDIYTEDEKRHEALGNLVIAFGPTELIKKLDSENMKSPNMSHKFNYDKKWVRDNFKSEKR